MKKEEIYNEAIGGDEGFAPGEGYPSCDGQPCANVSGDDGVATDTMTDATPTGDEGPSDGAASGEAGEESGVEAGGSEQLAPELSVGSPNGRTNTCVCRPNSTTIASVRCARRWSWSNGAGRT